MKTADQINSPQTGKVELPTFIPSPQRLSRAQALPLIEQIRRQKNGGRFSKHRTAERKRRG